MIRYSKNLGVARKDIRIISELGLSPILDNMMDQPIESKKDFVVVRDAIEMFLNYDANGYSDGSDYLYDFLIDFDDGEIQADVKDEYEYPEQSKELALKAVKKHPSVYKELSSEQLSAVYGLVA